MMNSRYPGPVLCLRSLNNWNGRIGLGLFVLIAAIHANSFGQEFFTPQRDIVSMYLFNGQDETTFRAHLEKRSLLRLAQLAEVAQLDEACKSKLELAARGDLMRFYRCIGMVREKTKDFDIQDQEDMQKAWQEISPLQQRLSKGLLDEESLFHKVLESALSEEQNEAYHNYLNERNAAKHLAILKVSIAEVERTLPMLAEQRTALLEKLIDIKAPRAVPEGYDAYVGFIVMTKLDEKELAAIFDKPQLEAFKKLQMVYAAYDRAVTW